MPKEVVTAGLRSGEIAVNDHWVNKRQAAIQKLLYRLLELIMLGKLRHANSESGVSRRTKDYVYQVILAARFTDIEEDIRGVPVHHAGRVLAALAGKERCGKRYQNPHVYARARPQCSTAL